MHTTHEKMAPEKPAPEKPADTFPKLLLRNAIQLADKAALREKDLGIWQTWTWREMRDEVLAFAQGLATLGFKRADKLGVVGANRPRLYWSIAAAQCLGGVAVPIYADSVADEMHYVLKHADLRFLIAEDQEQVDKAMAVKEKCPALQHIIFDDPRGLKNDAAIPLLDFPRVQQLGRDFAKENPDFIADEIARGKGKDIAVFLYTSGTTGKPKGVAMTHANILITSQSGIQQDHLTEHEEVLSYLPMAWVGDHVFSYGQAYVAGFCINCPEGAETVTTDLREIGPTFYFAPPRIFENILTSVMLRIEDAGAFKQKLFHYFMAVARRVGVNIINQASVPFIDKIKYWFGNLLIYAPLKNSMGFSRIRVAYTAGEAIGPEIFDFFRALGINIKQLYGQTEASVYVTAQPDGEVFADTVGKPCPGVEVKFSDPGEVMYRSPGVFHSYHKDEAATRDTKTEDGWVMTGDAGYFDVRGHLKIIDRMKDVGTLGKGSLFAPKFIENKLKFSPQIREAVAFGAARDFVTAMVNIDLDAVSNWAERNNIAYASYQELAGHPQVYAMLRDNITQVNRDLATDPQLAASQIRRFLILHKELDADDGELTRTRKVRRRIIAEKYAVLIDALYSGATSCFVTTQIVFEDGQQGALSADIKIMDVAVFAGHADSKDGNGGDNSDADAAIT